jgi:hypothetical protein
MSAGRPATQDGIERSSGVSNHTQMAELSESRLSNAVEKTVQFSLILAANPGRALHRREVACVMVGADSKARGFWCGINEDGGESERVWRLKGTSWKMD